MMHKQASDLLTYPADIVLRDELVLAEISGVKLTG